MLPSTIMDSAKSSVELDPSSLAETITYEHAALVAQLTKSGSQIRHEMSGQDAHLAHMALGVCGEAGELADALKKGAIYQKKPYDRENVVEELGDLEFFMEGIRSSLQITRNETLLHNQQKLLKRYEQKTYTNASAQARADKIRSKPENLQEFERRATEAHLLDSKMEPKQ